MTGVEKVPITFTTERPPDVKCKGAANVAGAGAALPKGLQMREKAAATRGRTEEDGERKVILGG